jgi:hypothetical protein
MGLEIFDLLLWWLGRTFWRILPFEFARKRNLSDGSYEAIGLLLLVLVITLFFVF